MKQKVVEILSGLLSDFSQSKSDAVSIEATQFEKLEMDFKNYIETEIGESFIIELIEKMCVESLNPHLYSYWLVIKNTLSINRIGLIENTDWENEANRATEKLSSETLDILKKYSQWSQGGEVYVPDIEDAINCCHLNV